ncbi:hypothetical protein DOZ80_25045 [Pseudomonas fluorescens]|uniref:Uncharacterized protein n=2 Tax=Pseudomonas fluorescens TaxID=294 RepID=A0A327MPI1_PSEFL|nr:hypothetical protein DOZ80_25045 [Pseudomonas fluorescens]
MEKLSEACVMISIGSFVHTTRSADLCYVLRSNSQKSELRICRLLDGRAYWLPSKHVIAEAQPAERFREHVRAVVDVEKATNASAPVKFSNFSEYLIEYLSSAFASNSKHVIDATVNFLIIVLNEQDNGDFERSFEVFYQDVCWFCYQLGMENPSESIVRVRLASIKAQSSTDPGAGDGCDEV